MSDIFRIGNTLMTINGDIAGGIIIPTDQQLVTTFENSQISSGNWDLCDEMFHFGMQTEEAGLIGIKGVAIATVTNSPTWTAGLGYPTLNGTTQYIETNFIPNVDGVSYSLNDALIGAFVISDDDAGNGEVMSAYSTGNAAATEIYRRSPAAGGNDYSLNVTSPSDEGTEGIPNNTLVLIGRNGTSCTWSENGIVQVTKFIASTAKPTVAFYLGARNLDDVASIFWAGGVSSCVIGAKAGFDEVDFYDNLVILNEGLAAL